MFTSIRIIAGLLLFSLTYYKLVGSAELTRSPTLCHIGKLQGVTPIKSIIIKYIHLCMMVCDETPECEAVQHNSVDGSCELLNVTMCDGEDLPDGYNLDSVADWKFCIGTNETKAQKIMFRTPECTSRDCSTKCARYLGESCLDDDQCLALSENSHCNDTNGNGHCVCDQNYWKYNETLCLQGYYCRIVNWQWLIKNMVNNACKFDFSVKLTQKLEIMLRDSKLYHTGTKDIRLYIDFDNTKGSTFKENGITYWDNNTYPDDILKGTLQNFTVGFCNGILEFGFTDEPPLLFHKMVVPFDVTLVGLRSHNQPSNGYTFFKNNLVDSYYPQNMETRTLRTDGAFWIEFKLTPDHHLITTVSLIFSLKADDGCVPTMLFGKFNDHRQKYQMMFDHGGYCLRLYDIATGSWHTNVICPKLLSQDEFRTFWITIQDGSFKIGSVGNSTAILSYTPSSSYLPSFNVVSMYTHHRRFGYWKFLSHPEVHDHFDGCYN